MKSKAGTSKSLVVLASGTGSTFQALVEASKNKKLNFHISALIVDRECQAQDRAVKAGVSVCEVYYKVNPLDFAIRLHNQLNTLNPNIILLSGFLRKIPAEIINDYRGRIFNSHPSLLPKHGGAGLYGRKVHESVLRSGDAESGVTFHHVTENYDEGPAISQAKIRIDKSDTVESIEEKVKALEKQFLIEQLNKL